jgi:hypothetical protein
MEQFNFYVGSKVKACQESVLNLLWLNSLIAEKKKGVK